jgi:nucleoside-diphosphate-sugar epimerase
MKVLVTGASGRIGGRVAREFLNNGHDVRALDRTAIPHELRRDAEVVYADLTDRLALFRSAEGAEAIVHLAAIPHPNRGEDDLFPNNVTGTQWILAAAEAHGISRVAMASSCSAYGFAFARNPLNPQYLPVDEEHPLLPQDMYGLSKQLNEKTAQAYARRGMTTVCLRMPQVLSLPGDSPRRRRMLSHAFTMCSADLWGYVAVEDVARAFRLAVEVPLSGFHVFNIVANDSFGRGDVRQAVREHFPSIAKYVEKLQPDSALYSSSRALEVLGFKAAMSWRQFPELAEDAAGT